MSVDVVGLLERRVAHLERLLQKPDMDVDAARVEETSSWNDEHPLGERVRQLEQKLQHTLTQRPLLNQLSQQYYEKYNALLLKDEFEFEQSILSTEAKKELCFAGEQDVIQAKVAIEEITQLESHVNPPEFRRTSFFLLVRAVLT